MIRFAADVDPLRRSIRSARCVRIEKLRWRLFETLYRADLEDGDPRSAAQLAKALGPHGGNLRSPVTIRRHMRELQWCLEGSRFAVAGDLAHGWRLIVTGPPQPPPTTRNTALEAISPEAATSAINNVLRLLEAIHLLAMALSGHSAPPITSAGPRPWAAGAPRSIPPAALGKRPT